MAENIDAERRKYEAARAALLKENPYPSDFDIWQMARRTPSASIGEDGLPELPEASEYSATRMLPNGELAPRFTGMQMRQYASDAVAADRRARKSMTYDEFFAEAERLGCKLPPEMLLPPETGAESPQAAQGVKTWQERARDGRQRGMFVDDERFYMRAEIEGLRAQLARQSQGDEAEIYAIWDTAKAEAAMYVEAHCVDGEMHAQHIMSAACPRVTAAPPLSSEQQEEKGEHRADQA